MPRRAAGSGVRRASERVSASMTSGRMRQRSERAVSAVNLTLLGTEQ